MLGSLSMRTYLQSGSRRAIMWTEHTNHGQWPGVGLLIRSYINGHTVVVVRRAAVPPNSQPDAIARPRSSAPAVSA